VADSAAALPAHCRPGRALQHRQQQLLSKSLSSTGFYNIDDMADDTQKIDGNLRKNENDTDIAI
jgi:hypothetical protein